MLPHWATANTVNDSFRDTIPKQKELQQKDYRRRIQLSFIKEPLAHLILLQNGI